MRLPHLQGSEPTGPRGNPVDVREHKQHPNMILLTMWPRGSPTPFTRMRIRTLPFQLPRLRGLAATNPFASLPYLSSFVRPRGDRLLSCPQEQRIAIISAETEISATNEQTLVKKSFLYGSVWQPPLKSSRRRNKNSSLIFVPTPPPPKPLSSFLAKKNLGPTHLNGSGRAYLSTCDSLSPVPFVSLDGFSAQRASKNWLQFGQTSAWPPGGAACR